MNQDERDAMLREVHQGFYGVTGTDEKGLLGEFKTLAKSHYRLKRVVYMTGAALVAGGGGVTAFIAKLINASSQ